MPIEPKSTPRPGVNRPSGRWFAVILLRYNDRDPFWDRDAGLFYEGFRANGVDTRFVAIGESRTDQDQSLLLATETQMAEPGWWKQWGLEGVVLYSWALPRFTPIAKAIHEAGAKLVLTLDADGGRSPRGYFLRHLHVKYIYAKMAGQWLPGAVALAKTLAAWPNWRYTEMMRHLEFADWIGVQSPLAKQRLARFLVNCGSPHLVTRLTLVHHPVQSHMRFDPAVTKEPLIVAVGSWERLVKGAALLVEVLGLALQRDPHYRARIIGSGRDSVNALAANLPPCVRDRIEITGLVPNKVLHRHYQAARIIINTSYSESFGIAAAEALCCGCSVVGSALLSAFNYFCSESSGTLATARTPGHFCDALCAEMEAWSVGRRDPERISDAWCARVHAPNVVRSVLELPARNGSTH